MNIIEYLFIIPLDIWGDPGAPDFIATYNLVGHSPR
jgi:hypothetical protein